MPESKSGALPLGDIPISALDSDTRGIIAWVPGKCKRKILVFTGFSARGEDGLPRRCAPRNDRVDGA